MPDIVAAHPARGYPAGRRPGRPDHVSVDVRPVAQAQPRRLAEQVTLHAPAAGRSAAVRVRSLLIGDLPVNLWWSAPMPPPMGGAMLDVADRAADHLRQRRLADTRRAAWRRRTPGLEQIERAGRPLARGVGPELAAAEVLASLRGPALDDGSALADRDDHRPPVSARPARRRAGLEPRGLDVAATRLDLEKRRRTAGVDGMALPHAHRANVGHGYVLHVLGSFVLYVLDIDSFAIRYTEFPQQPVRTPLRRSF